MSQDAATLITREKQARQHYDRLMAAGKSHDDGGTAGIEAEWDLAKREWEAARKRLDAFQAEGERGS